MASKWEMGWCTREPSQASSMPLFLSSLNQGSDPQALEGFLALAGHRPTIISNVDFPSVYNHAHWWSV
ncbi:hypothetical protein NC651_003865 [Populus alba x Populus x berolinensis]|nr:hypothetical protein NC651_003865 [Populus alba x Populus x berolinensis]